MALNPFSLQSSVSYGDEIYVGPLPVGTLSTNYTQISGLAFANGTTSNVFGFCCGTGGVPTCKACTTIPPCPPPPPPAPVSGALQMFVKNPFQIDAQRLAGSSTTKYLVTPIGDVSTVLAAITAFHQANFTGPMAYHTYQVTASSIPELQNQVIVIPVATV